MCLKSHGFRGWLYHVVVFLPTARTHILSPPGFYHTCQVTSERRSLPSSACTQTVGSCWLHEILLPKTCRARIQCWLTYLYVSLNSTCCTFEKNESAMIVAVQFFKIVLGMCQVCTVVALTQARSPTKRSLPLMQCWGAESSDRIAQSTSKGLACFENST